jgi:hypothetical protein
MWPSLKRAASCRPALRARGLGRMLTAAALTVTAFCSGAAASGNFTYHGNTSQGKPIFFLVYSGAVNDMWFRIIDSCPKHRVLFVTDRNVPSMTIKHGKFHGRFHAHGSSATLTISGRIAGHVAHGTVTDRTKSVRIHKFCSGQAMFKLRPG